MTDLEPFKAWLRAEGLADTTITAYLGHVRAMLRERPDGDVVAWATVRFADAPTGTARAMRHALRRWLAFRGIDPASVQLPAGKRAPRRLREAMSLDELADYETAIRAADLSTVTRAILLLLPLTGLRIHEACQLRSSDIRHIDGVRGLFIRGKGQHERFVPLLDEAAAVLDSYLSSCMVAPPRPAIPREEVERYLREHPPAKDPYLFPGRTGRTDGHIWPDSVRARLRELRTRREIIPHVLRHTFATRCLHGGMPLPVLQRLLGHADLRTTSIYLHVRPLDAADALRRAWGAR